MVWTKIDQGLILSAYYWGYLITHIPGGWLAERWGSKQVLAISLLVQALPSFFIPLCAYASPYAVIAMRILQGMGGVSHPGYRTTAVSYIDDKTLPFVENNNNNNNNNNC